MYDSTLSIDRTLSPDALPSSGDATDTLPLSALDGVGGGNAEPTPWEAYFFEAWAEDSL